MPTSFTRFRQRIFLGVGSSLIASFLWAGEAFAHRRGSGLGAFFEGSPGSGGYSLVMGIVISGMIAAMLGLVFYLRWRSAHPLPEPDSVRSIVEEKAVNPKRETPPEAGDNWERSADWWKPGSDSGGN